MYATNGNMYRVPTTLLFIADHIRYILQFAKLMFENCCGVKNIMGDKQRLVADSTLDFYYIKVNGMKPK